MADVPLSARYRLKGKKNHVKPVVLTSIETPNGSRCVDIFERENGTFGFEEWRRDVESAAGWFVVGHYADREYDTRNAALADAQKRVRWMVEV